ncbi:MAG: hypothetical protein IIB00_11075 [candidate division Zixibacteria bacterium]|nr:hypothetical protein [candidate division Zixibacteria bacterium]
MARRIKAMQELANEYLRAMGETEIAPDLMFEWAYQNRKWGPTQESLRKQFKQELGPALREEYYKDPQGRQVRTKLAIVRTRDGKQTSLWGDSRIMSRKKFTMNVHYRRKHIVGECFQLKTDVDSYNDNTNNGKLIPLELNFGQDVAEREIKRKSKSKAKSSRPIERVRPSRQFPSALPGSASQPAPAHL